METTTVLLKCDTIIYEKFVTTMTWKYTRHKLIVAIRTIFETRKNVLFYFWQEKSELQSNVKKSYNNLAKILKLTGTEKHY